MVSTKSNTKGGGPREKGSQQKSQNFASKSPTIPVTTTEPPAGKKATAEQIRMANMIYSDSTEMDNDKIKEKVQQIRELTNRTEDEIQVVLYDANYDTEQAINMLLERDETESKQIDGWVTTSSKKSKTRSSQSGKSAKDQQQDLLEMDLHVRGNKSDRDRSRGGRDRNDQDHKERGQDNDRRRDRDGGGYRGRGRGGRGPLPPRMTRGKGREYDGGSSRDRYRGGEKEFGGRGRGRRNAEMNGPSRNTRGGSGRSFTNSSYNDRKPVENDAFNSGDNVWRNPPETENWDDTEASSPKEDWGTEEWSGDLTHTQVFTATTTSDEPTTNSIDATPQPAAPDPTMPSVTTTQYDGGQSQDTISYSPSEPFQSSSMYSQNSTSVPQQSTGIPELARRSIDLNELFRTQSQHSAAQPTLTSGALPVSSSKADPGIFSPFQNFQPSTNIPSGEPPKPSSQLVDGAGPVQSSLSRAPQMPTSQTSHQPRTQTQHKPTRKKLPASTSKFPTGVEMPISARGLGPLDVQFGAMDINIDPAITDYGIALPGTSLSAKTTDLTSSGAFSDATPSAAGHLSYNVKVSETYSSGIGSSRMSSSVPLTVSSSSLDQSARSAYGHGQSQKLVPEPIPLPTQNELKSSSYMGSQKPSTSVPMDSTVATSGVSLPSSVGITTSVLPPSSGFGHSAGQQLSSTRQSNSYGSPSSGIPTTVSASVSGYGTPTMSSQGLAGSAAIGVTGSIGVSSSPLGPTSTIGGSGMGTSSMGSATTMGTTSVINGGSGTNPMGYATTSVQSSNMSPLPSNSAAYPSSVSSAALSQAATHTSVQTSPLTNIPVMDSRTSQHVMESSVGTGGLSSVPSAVHGSSSTTAISSISSSATTLPSVSVTTPSSTSLGYSNAASTLSTSMSGSGSISSSGIKPSAKVPPNLPPGMPFVNHHLIMGGHGLLPVNAFAQQLYNYDEFMLQRMHQPPMGYPYDLQQFQQLATTLNTGRDAASLPNPAAYSVTEPSKFPRNDAASPVASSLSSQQQQAGGHHQTQAQTQTPFLNPTLPPGYAAAGYGSIPYGSVAYPSAGIIPPGLSYPIFPAVSTVQPPSRTQAGSTPHSGYQQSAFAQPASYGTNTAVKRVSGYQPFGHPGPQPNLPGAFGTLQGYDDLTQPGDFAKGFSNQSQAKGSAANTARGTVSVSSASDGVSGSYGSKSHSQSYAADKHYQNQTPPPFNFPMANATQAGHAGATYATPFVPLFPGQHHSAMPLHQIPGDTGGAASSQRSQGSSAQNKQGSGKPTYGAYWGN